MIRHIRESLGLTQQEFAARLDVSQATVSRWEAGRTRPDASVRRRIAELGQDVGANGDASLIHMIQTSTETMALTTPDLHILTLSEGYCTRYGINHDDAVGISYRPYLTEELADVYDQAVAAGLLTGALMGVTYAARLTSLDGDTHPVIGHMHALPRPSGGEPMVAWSGRVVSDEECNAFRATGAIRVSRFIDLVRQD